MNSETICLVDLENVGTKALYQYMEHHKDTVYVIFYSDNTPSPGPILEIVSVDTSVSFINCHTGSDNAMDFCICATAGKYASDAKRKIEIMSDDKGYDSMIQMLQEQGIHISRKTAQGVRSGKVKEKDCNNTSLVKAIKEFVPERYQSELIKLLPGAVSRKQAHEIIQSVVPQNIVAESYKKIKKYIPKEGM